MYLFNILLFLANFFLYLFFWWIWFWIYHFLLLLSVFFCVCSFFVNVPLKPPKTPKVTVNVMKYYFNQQKRKEELETIFFSFNSFLYFLVYSYFFFSLQLFLGRTSPILRQLGGWLKICAGSSSTDRCWRCLCTSFPLYPSSAPHPPWSNCYLGCIG